VHGGLQCVRQKVGLNVMLIAGPPEKQKSLLTAEILPRNASTHDGSRKSQR